MNWSIAFRGKIVVMICIDLRIAIVTVAFHVLIFLWFDLIFLASVDCPLNYVDLLDNLI